MRIQLSILAAAISMPMTVRAAPNSVAVKVAEPTCEGQFTNELTEFSKVFGRGSRHSIFKLNLRPGVTITSMIQEFIKNDPKAMKDYGAPLLHLKTKHVTEANAHYMDWSEFIGRRVPIFDTAVIPGASGSGAIMTTVDRSLYAPSYPLWEIADKMPKGTRTYIVSMGKISSVWIPEKFVDKETNFRWTNHYESDIFKSAHYWATLKAFEMSTDNSNLMPYLEQMRAAGEKIEIKVGHIERTYFFVQPDGLTYAFSFTSQFGWENLWLPVERVIEYKNQKRQWSNDL